jgi:ATP-dependent DNA helicase RecG
MSGTQVTDLAALTRKHRGSEEYVAVLAQVTNVEVKGRAPKQRLEVRLSDDRGGSLSATFFGRNSLISYWKKILDHSRRGIFAGKLSWFHDAPQLAHPAFVMITDEGYVGSVQNMKMAQMVSTTSLIGLYPQTSKLPTWTVSESIVLALAGLEGIEDPLPEWVRQRAQVPSLMDAFHAVHRPTNRETYDQGVRRLIFDEALATQVAMAYRRQEASHHQAVPRHGGRLLEELDSRLPFSLTHEQVLVSQEIADDLGRTTPMQRLLQGEVGSGKTILALRALVSVVDSGGQGVLLAPTEVLAHQHYNSITEFLGPLGQGSMLSGGSGTQCVLLTGSMTASARQKTLDDIHQGRAGIIIGTHALLGDSVNFHDLALVVVDEQHRFGVEQRNALVTRNNTRPHVLVMTATPIPRSVAMTIFADLDVSTLKEVPAGRGDVSTTVIDVNQKQAWVDRAWQRVREEVEAHRQVYIVAPRIDPQDSHLGTSVTELAQMLETGPLHTLRLAVLHGRLPSGEKAAVMSRFAHGEIDVLVATSMIEVGLDQPNATMMIIVDAEMFGVSQLHQLRGRIGRGGHGGVCLLFTTTPAGSDARARLEAVASTRDGFQLAEIDLEARREGDVLGMAQSGRRSSLRLLKVLEHAEIIDGAREIAADILSRDPDRTHAGIADYVADIEARAQGDLEDAT